MNGDKSVLMSHKAAKRREVATKLSAAILRLKTEIADRRAKMAKARARALAAPGAGKLVSSTWFAEWSRRVEPIAQRERSLERTVKRLPIALEAAEDAEFEAREKAVAILRIKAANVGHMRRLDALRSDARSFDEQQKKERREEEKRVRKLKQQHKARFATQDLMEVPDWLKRPLPLPPLVQQPPLSDEGEMLTPPRPGLLPGTFKLARPRVGRLVDEDPLPARWTWEHVGTRLIEAHAVFKRLPASYLPKGCNTAWPAFQLGARDLAEAEEPMVTVLRGASPIELQRAGEAIVWPMQFLAHEPWRAQDVNLWAMQAVEVDTPETPVSILQRIAKALNAAKEEVR